MKSLIISIFLKNYQVMKNIPKKMVDKAFLVSLYTSLKQKSGR